jgi:hypothetical protein
MVAVALGICMVFAFGCEKSGTSGGSTTVSTSGAPSKGGGDDAYSKKLVGVWEGKEDFGGKEEIVTVEFKSGGGFSAAMGPLEFTGTWKLIKEDGKTVTFETEVTLKGFDDPKSPKPDKKSFTAVFDDADTFTMSRNEGKPDPKKLKRKK